MIATENLKPFLLHENDDVRKEIVRYFSYSYSEDPDLIPLILKACEKYGHENNAYLLAMAGRLRLTQDPLEKILEMIPDVDDENSLYHLIDRSFYRAKP